MMDRMSKIKYMEGRKRRRETMGKQNVRNEMKRWTCLPVWQLDLRGK
jgi:hypothetical protein